MSATFSYSDIELAQITKTQVRTYLQDRSNPFCQILPSNHFPVQDMAKTGIKHF